jgi:regulator of protease activity HflC (stomatin/prohibitin superfamily)
MGELLQKIIDNLHALWPVRIVDADEQGVLRDRGKYLKLRQPGIHLFIPGLQKIDVFNVRHQEVDCGVQSMETKDGQAVSFSINVGYRITDAARMVLEFQYFDSTLRNLARGLMATAIQERTYADLQGKLPDLAKEVRRSLRRVVARGGIRVRTVRLDEFVQAPQLRLLGSSVVLT